MSTTELKELLKSKISEIDDVNYLNALNTILDTNSEILESYNLDLKKSEKDISDGKVYTQDQVAEKIAQWKKR